jgi:hypothetical protein
VTDPGTGKPAVRNLFHNSKIGPKQESAAKDPDDLNSIYQDTRPCNREDAVSELSYRP